MWTAAAVVGVLALLALLVYPFVSLPRFPKREVPVAKEDEWVVATEPAFIPEEPDGFFTGSLDWPRRRSGTEES